MGKVIAAILVILVIAAVVFFFFFRGKGFGTGGQGSAPSNEQPAAAVTTAAPEAEPAEAEVKTAEVKIKEDKYIYNGGEYELDALVTELKKLDEGTRVRITDEGGLVDAKNSLTDALGKENISFVDDTAV